MSLVVWLPLTKDLRQQGLSNVEAINSGATYSSTGGKLGGCYSFDGTDDRIYIDNLELNNSAMSACCWVKLNNLTSSDYPYIFALGSNTSGPGIQIGLAFWKSDTKIHLVGNGSEPITTYTPPINTWIHFCITIKGSESKLYVNGELIQTVTNSNSPKIQKYLCIGARPNSTSGAGVAFSYPISGYISDFRLYDHCLSPMEVKQISQGLVLHYPLNRNGWGQENLLLSSNVEKTVSSSIIEWSLDNDAKANIKEKTYVISADIKCSSNNSKIDCYVRSPSTSQSMSPATVFTGITTEYKRYSLVSSCTVSLTGTPTTFCFNCNGRNGSTTGVTFSIKNVKLEYGDKVTSWCPNSADALATTMGLNSTTEYDCSGFYNNGTKYDISNYVSNTSKYSVSTYFNGISSVIYSTIPRLGLIGDCEFTLAAWIYWDGDSWTNNIQGIVWNNNTSANKGAILSTWNGRINLDFWGLRFYCPTQMTVKQWHHIAATKTPGIMSADTCKLYVDGVNVSGQCSYDSDNYKNIIPNITENGINIGRLNAATGRWFKGMISDARVYTTALSADDVRALYENSGYIANNGTTYAYEFIEE